MPDIKRETEIIRQTAETDIKLKLSIDGSGIFTGSTGIGFFDHMLSLFCRHGFFDMALEVKGDIHVDFHHTVEDMGICIGMAFFKILEGFKGIRRYGNATVPMDETLMLVALDLSGRSYLNFDVEIPSQKIGEFDTELAEEFYMALARNLNASIHIKKLAGTNSHHIIEAIFKGFGRAMGQAVTMDSRLQGRALSTKGSL